MGGQNLYELAFETVVKFITSLILDVKREKTHREQPMFSCLHPKLLGNWSLRNSGYKQKKHLVIPVNCFLRFTSKIIDFRDSPTIFQIVSQSFFKSLNV